MDNIRKFILAIEKVQDRYGLYLAVDDANPFEMVVRRATGNEEVLAWLGVNRAEIKEELLILNNTEK